jgi:hypothetical protein
MPDIKNYKREKRNALVMLLIISAFFIGIFFRAAKDDVLLMIFIVLIILWTKFFVDYEKICLKIEILKELQGKANQSNDSTNSQ